MNISFTSAAIADLEAIQDYIGQFDARAADKVIARIDTSIAFLATFPEIGRKGRIPDTRELIVPDTNYIVVYEIPARSTSGFWPSSTAASNSRPSPPAAADHDSPMAER